MSTFERMDLTQFDGATPGPWVADPTPETLAGGDYQARVIAPGVLPDGATAIITGCPYNGNRNHLANIHWPPNAALIAAAPDLLDALRSAYSEIDRLTAELAALREQVPVWTTVQPGDGPGGLDSETLPDQDAEREVLVDTQLFDEDGETEMRTHYVLRLETDDVNNLTPGDRWTYIPEVTS